MNHSYLWIAVALVVVWILARVLLAVTSFFLHVLWIAALAFLIVWLAKKFL
jgi:hypothetical protein